MEENLLEQPNLEPEESQVDEAETQEGMNAIAGGLNIPGLF